MIKLVLTRYKKSQAAMEFLMTYGWAILVVLAAIAALAYFGVLSPEKFLPEKCLMETGFTCISAKIEPYQSFLVLQNGYGKTIIVNEITIGECTVAFTETLQSEEDHTFPLTGCDNGEEKEVFKGEITIKYTEKATELDKTGYGQINTKIEADSSTLSENICQNAEDGGLCDGLDILYGMGYKQACCDEYGLCC